MWSKIPHAYALVAQWIRALACGAIGRVFESRRGRQKAIAVSKRKHKRSVAGILKGIVMTTDLLHSKAIEGFLIARRADGYRPQTIQQYLWALKIFLELGNPPFNKIDTEYLRGFCFATSVTRQELKSSSPPIRRTFAIESLRNGEDVFTLQRILEFRNRAHRRLRLHRQPSYPRAVGPALARPAHSSRYPSAPRCPSKTDAKNVGRAAIGRSR